VNRVHHPNVFNYSVRVGFPQTKQGRIINMGGYRLAVLVLPSPRSSSFPTGNVLLENGACPFYVNAFDRRLFGCFESVYIWFMDYSLHRSETFPWRKKQYIEQNCRHSKPVVIGLLKNDFKKFVRSWAVMCMYFCFQWVPTIFLCCVWMPV
jgi:hypothetical protein